MIEGDVIIEVVTTPIRSATLYVRVQDVSRADAGSTVVAETALRGISLQAGSDQKVPFQLEVPALSPRGQYIVTAHLDLDNSGTVTPGDYLTMESIPIRESSPRGRLSIPARRVS